MAVVSASSSVQVPNQARVVARAGTLMGAFLVVAAAAHGSGPGGGLGADLPWMALFATGGIALVLLGGAVLDLVFLGSGAHGVAAETARGNCAAGVTRGGHRVAMGIVASACMYGADLRGLGVSTAFVVLGLGTLLGFQRLHRLITRYADDQEVRGQNLAAALSSAGLTLALAVIVAHAAEGTFQGWAASLRGYALALLLAAGLYPVRQVLVKRVLLGYPLTLRGHPLDRAIAEERNALIGAVEGLTYIATALLMTGLL